MVFQQFEGDRMSPTAPNLQDVHSAVEKLLKNHTLRSDLAYDDS